MCPEILSEDARISALRIEALRRGRPDNIRLLCCDYNHAEKANTLGIPGPPEYGGGHLCMECLGLEYNARELEVDEWDAVGDSNEGPGGLRPAFVG